MARPVKDIKKIRITVTIDPDLEEDLRWMHSVWKGSGSGLSFSAFIERVLDRFKRDQWVRFRQLSKENGEKRVSLAELSMDDWEDDDWL